MYSKGGSMRDRGFKNKSVRDVCLLPCVGGVCFCNVLITCLSLYSQKCSKLLCR